MGSGAALAKDKASMILTNNSFDSCLRGMMWGRNIYTNVKRFLQFQVAVNFSILIVILIGLCFMFESPLQAAQLLWLNLIMDVLGALALATSPPLTTVVRQKPQVDGNQIIDKVIWRQIFGICLWNVMVMCIIIFFGKFMFGTICTNNLDAEGNIMKDADGITE